MVTGANGFPFYFCFVFLWKWISSFRFFGRRIFVIDFQIIGNILCRILKATDDFWKSWMVFEWFNLMIAATIHVNLNAIVRWVLNALNCFGFPHANYTFCVLRQYFRFWLILSTIHSLPLLLSLSFFLCHIPCWIWSLSLSLMYVYCGRRCLCMYVRAIIQEAHWLCVCCCFFFVFLLAWYKCDSGA